MGVIKERKFRYTLYLMRAIRNMERRAPRSPSKQGFIRSGERLARQASKVCNIIGETTLGNTDYHIPSPQSLLKKSMI